MELHMSDAVLVEEARRQEGPMNTCFIALAGNVHQATAQLDLCRSYHASKGSSGRYVLVGMCATGVCVSFYARTATLPCFC